MTLTVAIWGPIGRDDMTGLCDRVCALLSATDEGLAVCDVEGAPADAVTVEALARLQLAARRRGCRMRLRGASDELAELVSFMGLENVFAN